MAVLLPVGAFAVLGVEALVAARGPATPAAPSGIDRAGPGPPVVWLGDSTAAGVGATVAESTLPRLVAGPQAAGKQVPSAVAAVVDLAVSGARVADIERHQLPRFPARASVVYISIGANDTVHLTSVATFRRTYGHVLRALRGRAERVVLLGVPDMGSPTRLPQPLRAVAGWRGRRLDREVRRLANRNGATWVDIAGHTGPQFRRHPGALFAADHYHPNDAGYRLWADAIHADAPPSS